MNDDRDQREALDARRKRFERLYAEHHARVLGYVLRRAQPGDAADIVAETFLVAWRRLDDAPVGETHLWLYGVARRVLANHRRGERRRSYYPIKEILGRDTTYTWHRYEVRSGGPAATSLFSLAARHPRALVDDSNAGFLAAWHRLTRGD